MTTRRQIHPLFFDSLLSTQDWIKTNYETLDPEFLTCVIAKEQTAGRGQFNRKWISWPGNLFMSLYFTTQKKGSSNWGQILSLACILYLRKEGVMGQIKWPNDILLEGKKLGGVLTETVDLGNKMGVILGFGLNIFLPYPILETIDQPATSLETVYKKSWDVKKIGEGILEEFLSCLELFEKEGFPSLLPLYLRYLNLQEGDPLAIQQGDLVITGSFQRIDQEGALVLKQPGKEAMNIRSGSILSDGRMKEGSVWPHSKS